MDFCSPAEYLALLHGASEFESMLECREYSDANSTTLSHTDTLLSL
jgi:hypothetical protein